MRKYNIKINKKHYEIEIETFDKYTEIFQKNLEDELNFLIKDCEHERNKKLSFETRAGLILTSLGLVYTILFQFLSHNAFKKLPFLFIVSIAVVSLITIVTCIIILWGNKQLSSNFDNIDSEIRKIARLNRISYVIRMISHYNLIGANYKNHNDKKANILKVSFFSLVSLFIILVYIFLFISYN